MAQALTFASDFKLGHYMKSVWIGGFELVAISDLYIVAPRAMFWSQVRF